MKANTRIFNLVNLALTLSIGWISLEFIGLSKGWFDGFFWGSNPAVLGIDYWSVPRGFINILHGQSLYNTFNGAAFGGPLATWYLSHPIFAVVLGPLFAFFSSQTSYVLWTLCSAAIQLLIGCLFASRSNSVGVRAACILLSTVGFPAYAVLYTGNPHAWMVLGLSLVLLSLIELAQGRQASKVKPWLVTGLLISLFSKPLMLVALPMMLLMGETRRASFLAFGLYVLVSLLAVSLPALNPEGIGWSRNLDLLTHPDYVREHMNVYANHFVLAPEMLDNTVHWFNMIAQSGFYWDHAQIFSLSAFLNNLTGQELNPVYFKIPLWVAVLSSLAVAMVKQPRQRFVAAIWSLMSLSLSFFLSYNTVWEYQFYAVVPLVLATLLMMERGWTTHGVATLVILPCLVVAAPSLYFLIGRADISAQDFPLIRATRVIPVSLLFFITLAITWRTVMTSRQQVFQDNQPTGDEAEPYPLATSISPAIMAAGLLVIAGSAVFLHTGLQSGQHGVATASAAVSAEDPVDATQRLIRQRLYQKAIDVGDVALKEDSSNARLLNNVAIAEILMGRSGQAQKRLQRALVFSPGTALYVNNLKWAATVQKDNEHSLAQAQGALDRATLAPEKSRLWVTVARLRENLGAQAAEVSAAYEQALQLDSANEIAHNNFGVFLMSLGRAREAEQQFSQAAAINPQEPLYRNNQAWAQAISKK